VAIWGSNPLSLLFRSPSWRVLHARAVKNTKCDCGSLLVKVSRFRRDSGVFRVHSGAFKAPVTAFVCNTEKRVFAVGSRRNATY
jgi:hypothetical protein